MTVRAATICFCTKCGGSALDVNHWVEPGVAVFRCYDCGNESPVRGFTLGRVLGTRYLHREALASGLVTHAAEDAPLGPDENNRATRRRASDLRDED